MDIMDTAVDKIKNIGRNLINSDSGHVSQTSRNNKSEPHKPKTRAQKMPSSQSKSSRPQNEARLACLNSVNCICDRCIYRQVEEDIKKAWTASQRQDTEVNQRAKKDTRHLNNRTESTCSDKKSRISIDESTIALNGQDEPIVISLPPSPVEDKSEARDSSDDKGDSIPININAQEDGNSEQITATSQKYTDKATQTYAETDKTPNKTSKQDTNKQPKSSARPPHPESTSIETNLEFQLDRANRVVQITQKRAQAAVTETRQRLTASSEKNKLLNKELAHLKEALNRLHSAERERGEDYHRFISAQNQSEAKHRAELENMKALYLHSVHTVETGLEPVTDQSVQEQFRALHNSVGTWSRRVGRKKKLQNLEGDEWAWLFDRCELSTFDEALGGHRPARLVELVVWVYVEHFIMMAWFPGLSVEEEKVMKKLEQGFIKQQNHGSRERTQYWRAYTAAMLLQTPESSAKVTDIGHVVVALVEILERVYTPPHMDQSSEDVVEISQILQVVSRLAADIKCQRSHYFLEDKILDVIGGNFEDEWMEDVSMKELEEGQKLVVCCVISLPMYKQSGDGSMICITKARVLTRVVES